MEKIEKERKSKRDFCQILKFLCIIVFILAVVFTSYIYFYYSYIYKLDCVKKIIFLHNVLRIVITIYIFYRNNSVEYKLNSIIIIFLFPILGMLFYFFVGNINFSNARIERMKKINKNSREYLEINFDLLEEIQDKNISKSFNYIVNTSGYPIYKNEGVKYFETGERFWSDVLQKIENAKNYILIEFYMISEGDLLDKLLDALFSKAKQNVDIKIIIDNLGSKKKLPKNFKEKLGKENIEVLEFNKNILNINKFLSFRDHRKIIIIDGKYGYMGGINIADEYINQDEKYGYWKDGGILLRGTPITSYIVMFGKMYSLIKNEQFEYYHYIKQIEKCEEKQGYIMCVAKEPENIENLVENMFINFIYSSKKSIYIATPYLILSENLKQALINASNSGIQVKIIIPKIPDKLPVYKVTKSYYNILLKEGVEIYEYSLGFIHSKLFLIDDSFSSCGSINVDFRSFNLNYECTTLTYNTFEEEKIKKDFNSILRKSKKIKLEEVLKESIFEKILEKFFSIFKTIM